MISPTLGCGTSYRHNYSVGRNSGHRIYYGGVPEIIQVGEHHFIEGKVLNLFIGMMLTAWYISVLL